MFGRLLALLLLVMVTAQGAQAQAGAKPRIVNIVNFIREVEPRSAEITNEVLYQTVVSQIALFSKYKLPATYLLQYDALIDVKYQQLLKTRMAAGDEVGAWWEITQPHVEACGLHWRGRYPWDWHANVGFSTGYTPHERELLVDEYMKKFKSIFGRYPATVASWFIDEYSLAYMYDKYHIVASANCKDQIGTDGYTLWGGYWNQAYYPSRLNAYMPAQTTQGQIGVPVFRMLGSDPIYQYESGLGSNGQGVITLEPVYPYAGGSAAWVRWFMQSMANEPCLAFAYTQAGQENSFTWRDMQKGLEMQAPIFDSLQRAGKITVQTMEASGRWFKQHYQLTPATAVTALHDYRNQNHKTVWYNNRYYRANLHWSNDTLNIRDIHLFDEKVRSAYIDTPGTSTQCIYETLPFVDGNKWSAAGTIAGLRLVQLLPDGTTKLIPCKGFTVTESAGNQLLISWQLPGGQYFTILLMEDRLQVISTPTGMHANTSLKWALQLTAAPGLALPFTNITPHRITAAYSGFGYHITCLQGQFTIPTANDSYVLQILPENGKVVLSGKTE